MAHTLSRTVPFSGLEHFYVPFERMDEDKRTVSGYAFTSSRVKGDKWNLKRATLERASKLYMEMPCVRAMHAPIAAGKALSVRFDDKGAFIEAYIGDDNEWRKCKEGIYRGFSIGGKPLLVRGDDIEEFDWVETSLVDRPKDPGALFTVVRAEDGEGETEVTVLPEDASDEQLDVTRGELGLERYDHNQPRDDDGKWTIVAGHRVSVDGHEIDHNEILAAKSKFGLSDEATGALLQAHKDGKIQTDQHLYRTLSHAGAKSSNQGGMLHDVTSAHIESGIAHHGAGGSHENQWHSAAHAQAPKLQSGMSIGEALGVHQIQKGDIVHFPAHKGQEGISGVVHKVNKTSIDIGGPVGDAQVGMRVKKSDLHRPGFVKREHTPATEHYAAHSMLHHIEVNRGEEIEGEDLLRYHTEALFAVVARSQPGEAREAVAQVATQLQGLIMERENMQRGLTSDEVPARENLEGEPVEVEKLVPKSSTVLMMIEDALEVKDLEPSVESALKAAHAALQAEPLARAEVVIGDAVDSLRERLLETNDGSDTEPLIHQAMNDGREVLYGENIANGAEEKALSDEAPIAEFIDAFCDYLTAIVNSNNDDEPGVRAAINAVSAVLDGEGESVGRAEGSNPLRLAYAWFHEDSTAATFAQRTGAVLNESLMASFGRGFDVFVQTLMDAPDLDARLANVDGLSEFLKAWLKHDDAMRTEFDATAVGRGETVSESVFGLLAGALDLERLAPSRGWKTQPRDDGGKWTDGGGHLNASHVHDVMKAEGIHEAKHHDDVKAKIESGELKTREDVLRHIDSIHASRKTEKPSDTEVLAAADHHGLMSDHARQTLLDAHAQGHIQSHEQLDTILKHAVETHKKGDDVSGYLVSAINAHGTGGNYRESTGAPDGGAKGEADKPSSEDVAKTAEKHGLSDSEKSAIKGAHDGGHIRDKDELHAAAGHAKGKGPQASSGLIKTFLQGYRTGKEKVQKVMGAIGLGRGEGDVSLATEDSALARLEVIESELSTVQDLAQANLLRAESAEGEVRRLETEVEELRATPLELKRAAPVQFPAMAASTMALERSFAANGLMDSANGQGEAYAALVSRRDAAKAAAESETDPTKRARLVANWMALDGQLKTL